MSAMDVFAAVCFAVSMWAAVQYGAGRERDRAERRAATVAERTAARKAAVMDEAARQAAGVANVVNLDACRRQGRAS